MSIKSITVTVASDSALAPYGEFMTPLGKDPAFDSEVFSFWNDISVGEVNGAVSFGMVETKPGDPVAPMLERHLQTTESLVALDSDIILVLAEPTEGDVPNLENVAAFRVPRGFGVTLKAGTWHYVPLITGDIPARTLVVFRQGTPAEDLEVYDLKAKQDVTIRVAV